MGAAASIQQLYDESVQWFKQYIDTDTYMRDFQELDKDEDGGIGYGDLKIWIEKKIATEGKSWSIFQLSQPVLMIAHKLASGSQEAKENHATHGKVISIAEFRNFLVNLFAISILWVHFDSANSWGEDHDAATKQLDKSHFTRACQTLNASLANDQLTQEQIDADFEKLDVHGNGTIGFMEICKHCSQYLHNSGIKIEAEHIPKFFGKQTGPAIDVLSDLHTGPKLYFEAADVTEKNNRAIDALASAIERNNQIAHSPDKFTLVEKRSNVDLTQESAVVAKTLQQITIDPDDGQDNIQAVSVSHKSPALVSVPKVSGATPRPGSTSRVSTPRNVDPFSPKKSPSPKSARYNSGSSSKSAFKYNTETLVEAVTEA